VKSRKHSTEKTGRKPKESRRLSMSAVKELPSKARTYVASLGRNTKLALILVIVLLAVGGIIGLLGRNNSEEQPAVVAEPLDEIIKENAITATVLIADGTVETKNQEGDWREVNIEDVLVEGDDIRTIGATSRAEIEFENGSILRIDASSQVLLETMNVERIVIKQSDGYTYSRVIPVDNVSYVVKSTDAQYEAAGTAFQVITSGDEQAVEVYESTVIETITNQEVDQGKKLIVKSNTRPSDNGRIVNLDIEAIKQNSFMTWNRELDIENELFKSGLGFLSDITPPEITISSPADNETVYVEPNAQKGTVEFTGSSEAGITMKILSKSTVGATPVSVTVGSDGNFTTPVIEAPLGSSVFEFTATDRTGNRTIKNIRVSFQRKSAPITEGGIVLSVAESDNELEITWSYSGGFTPKDGVKIVYDTSTNPKLDMSDSLFEENSNSSTIQLSKLSDDTTYYFRACSYDQKKDTCSNYSNEVRLKTPKK